MPLHLRHKAIIGAGHVVAIVTWMASPWRDWRVGLAVGLRVLTGAIRMLKLR